MTSASHLAAPASTLPPEQTEASLRRVAVIIPALNEAANLAVLLPQVAALGVGQVIVGDNGSTDGTGRVARGHGADVATEPKRGYGAACHAAMQLLGLQADVVVFLDADLSDDVTMLPDLAGPILRDECDFVLGTRVAALRTAGAMTLPQRFANWLMPRVVALGWGHRYTDLGPFRAIRRSCLEAIDMQDRAYGWTIEMQIRAVEMGLRIHEVPVPYRPRVGRSKISGTLRGTLLAARWIIGTAASLYMTRNRRRRGAAGRIHGSRT